MTVVLGLDISSRSTATVAIPLSWDGKWSRVEWHVCGQPLPRGASDLARAQRCEFIASAIVGFAKRKGASVAWIEGYGFSRNTSAHTLAEVAGVVRLELVRAGIEIHTANMGSARKLLLGKVPSSRTQGKGAAKKAVYAQLVAHGARLPVVSKGGFDVADAIVCANHGLAELGGYAFAQVAA